MSSKKTHFSEGEWSEGHLTHQDSHISLGTEKIMPKIDFEKVMSDRLSAKKLLSILSERERKVLELKYWGGQSDSEIAQSIISDRTGNPVNRMTVTRLAASGLEKIRQRLKMDALKRDILKRDVSNL